MIMCIVYNIIDQSNLKLKNLLCLEGGWLCHLSHLCISTPPHAHSQIISPLISHPSQSIQSCLPLPPSPQEGRREESLTIPRALPSFPLQITWLNVMTLPLFPFGRDLPGSHLYTCPHFLKNIFIFPPSLTQRKVKR